MHTESMPSEKPVVSVRLPDDLRKAVDELAKQQDRSRNWVITDLIRKALTAQIPFRPSQTKGNPSGNAS